MITSKIILSEVQKFQDIYTKYIIINEYFEVVVIIGKLSLLENYHYHIKNSRIPFRIRERK